MSPRALLVAGLISTLVGEKAIADQDWYQMVQLPKPAHEVLPSGLQIVWFEDRNVPLVDLVLFMPIGFSSDPDGASGAGALVGGLLERGTKTQSATDISRAMDQLGASSMVSIDDDFGIVGIHGLSSDFFELARLLRTISIEADFPEVEIKRTKDLMKESIARMADHPGPLADLAFSRLIASGTPYARGRLQSEKQLMSISRNTLKQFHAAMLQPQKAVLLVIGKLPEADRDAVRKKLEPLWAPDVWPKVKLDKAFRSLERKKVEHTHLKPTANQVIVVDRPGAVQTQVRIGFRGPLYSDPDRFALAAANALLGRMFHSRLNTTVRDELGLTYGIESHFAYNKSLGVFQISASTRTEATFELIERTRTILREFTTTKLPSDEEVEKSKEFLIGEFPVEYSNVVALASRWMTGRFYGMGDSDLHESIPKIAALTKSDIHKAIQRHLAKGRLQIVVSGDLKAIKKVKGAPPIKAVTWKKLLQ